MNDNVREFNITSDDFTEDELRTMSELMEDLIFCYKQTTDNQIWLTNIEHLYNFVLLAVKRKGGM